MPLRGGRGSRWVRRQGERSGAHATQVPICVFGPEQREPAALCADEFLLLPRLGAPYSNEPLAAVYTRCLARRGRGMAAGLGGGGGMLAPLPQMGMMGGGGGGAQMQAQMGGGSGGNAEVMSMLAELMRLKQAAAMNIPATPL